jgi:hypothetical protein
VGRQWRHCDQLRACDEGQLRAHVRVGFGWEHSLLSLWRYNVWGLFFFCFFSLYFFCFCIVFWVYFFGIWFLGSLLSSDA